MKKSAGNLIQLIFVSVFLLVFLGTSMVFTATGQEKEESYSFIVFGDSRIPAYAPYDKKDKEQLDQLSTQLLNLPTRARSHLTGRYSTLTHSSWRKSC